MKYPTIVLAGAFTLLANPSVQAGGMEDDPLLFKFMAHKFEWRNAEGNPLETEAQAWLGKDLNKLWFKSKLEYANSEFENAELQLLYSRAIDPYWDVQIGIRHDAQPEPKYNWLALSLKGLAPWWIEMDTSLFIGEHGQAALRVEAEYEMMLTQRWVLSPMIEANFYSEDDAETGTQAGLNDMELGLRLGYEIRREFAPYIGVNWHKKFADSGEHEEHGGEEEGEVQFVAGIRVWF